MLLSEVEFGSLLAYCPRGDTKEHHESQQWMRYLKNDQWLPKLDSTTARFIAARMRARLEETPFASWFEGDVTLVPVPRSAPTQSHSLWIPQRIAHAFVAQELGKSVLACLLRTRAVAKSSLSPPSVRPKCQDHFESLSCTAEIKVDTDVMLIDDVVTRGATLLAAASRLKAAMPAARVRAFAVLRTITQPEEYRSLFAPVAGRIHLDESGKCFRRP